MSKPSPTGRLSESQPEFQDFPHPHPPGRRLKGQELKTLTEQGQIDEIVWGRLEERTLEIGRHYFGRRALGKSWLVEELLLKRTEYLREQRRIANYGVKQAVAAFINSFKR